MPLHRQVKVTLDGSTVEVDEGIAPLIEALANAGYRTMGSCEHLPNTEVAFVSFESYYQADRFNQLIGGGGTIMRPEDRLPEDWEGAVRLSPEEESATAVAFPAGAIDAALQWVRQETPH